MVFCPVVSIIEFAWTPINSELFLAFLVAKPMETHVHCLCAFGGDFAVDNTVRHCIVSLQWCGGLWMTHFFEDDSNIDNLSCTDV